MTDDDAIIYLSAEEWEWLTRRLEEPVVDLPGLRAFLAAPSPFDDEGS